MGNLDFTEFWKQHKAGEVPCVHQRENKDNSQIIKGIDMLRDRLRIHYLNLGEYLFFGGQDTKRVELFLKRIDIEKENCLIELEKQKV